MKNRAMIKVAILGIVIITLAFLIASGAFHARWIAISTGNTAEKVLSYLGNPKSTGTTFYPQGNGKLKRPGHLSYSWRERFIAYTILFDSETSTTNTMHVHDKRWHLIWFEKPYT